jgi:hypothetical protein
MLAGTQKPFDFKEEGAPGKYLLDDPPSALAPYCLTSKIIKTILKLGSMFDLAIATIFTFMPAKRA